MRRKPLVIASGITGLVVVALAAGALWWYPRTPAALEQGWTSRVLVLAGDGVRDVRDGDATQARFSDPFGVAISVDGAVYVTDGDRIRRISPDGQVTTVAGGDHGFTDGLAIAARFSTPSGIAFDASGTLYVADTGNNVIRRISIDGRVSTLAGDGVAGYRDGPAHVARFNGPIGIAVDAAGRVIVADTYNDRIRTVGRDGTVSTLAGSAGPGADDGPAMAARFHTPCGVAIAPSGNILVADTGNGLVRVIDTSGVVTTAAWSRAEGLFHPTGIAVSATGDVYVTDERGLILEASSAGLTRTLAGSTPGFRDDEGPKARFRRPTAIVVAALGRLVVADAGNALVRIVAAPSRIGLRPPASPRIDPRFDAERFDWQPLLWPVAPFEGPHEIAGTIGEVRGGDGTERFHNGIDVRVDEGTMVYAVRDGVVGSPLSTDAFGTLGEWLRVGDLTYVHIRAARKRRNDVFDALRFVATYEGDTLVGMRVKRGARFAAGETIGTVNPFNHVHLNVGWPGEEYNPLRFRLVQFEDTIAPTIARGGVRLYDEQGQPLTRRAHGRLVLSGRVQIEVDAWDQAEGNRPSRRLGLYDLGYQVLRRDGSPAPGFEMVRHTLRFDRLAPDPGTAGLVYARGSGIPFYGRRRTRFLYVVTNTLKDGIASQAFWDTSVLAPGDYIVRAWAADIRGNVAAANRDVPVTIVASDATAGAF